MQAGGQKRSLFEISANPVQEWNQDLFLLFLPSILFIGILLCPHNDPGESQMEGSHSGWDGGWGVERRKVPKNLWMG